MSERTLLLKLYLIAISDGDFAEPERNLLFTKGASFGLSENEINELINNPQLVFEKFPEEIDQKLNYIHSLCEMIWVDKHIDVRETTNFYSISRSMGFEGEKSHKMLNHFIDGFKSGKQKEELIADCHKLLETKPKLLQISPSGRLVIEDLDIELPFTPVSRALYIFLLGKAEGVRVSHLSDHREQILSIYKKCSNKLCNDSVELSINRLVDPHENAFNVNRAKINRKIDNALPKDISEHYKIQGSKGMPYFIPLETTLIRNIDSWT